MCGSRDRRALGARNVACETIAHHEDVVDVLVARDDECRNTDFAETLRRRRIEPQSP